jgi:Reverse transcriptase (RNA-dependent DNA polymerase)
MCGINKGVPQGSILGPILFTLYTSDLHRVMEHCTMHSYADDTQINLSYRPADFVEASRKINIDLQNCSRWFDKHGLQINCSKTSVITFKSRRSDFDSSGVHLYINNEELTHASLIRNLGIIFDEHLTFNDHISRLVRSSFAKLKAIYSFKGVLSSETKVKLSNSLILSKIEYGDAVYGPCLTEREAYRLQKVQNSCARYSLNIRRREHISQPIKDIGWLNMKQRWKLHLCCSVHKILYKKHPIYLNNKLSLRSQIHRVNLRFSGYTLNIPKYKTAIFKKSFSYMAPSLYNKLPAHVKVLSLQCFKYKVKQLIFCDIL